MKNIGIKVLGSSLFMMIVLAGCATKSGGTKVQLDYGTIESKELVTGNIKDTTLIGGYMGMEAIPVGPEATEANKNKNIKNASDTIPAKYRYTITKLNGSSVKVVTGKDFFARKDCVAIEKGHSYNLRLVEDSICQSGKVGPKALKAKQKPASDCVQAKRQMIIAQSDREFADSRQMVEVSCQFSRN